MGILHLYKEKISNQMFSINCQPGYCPWYVELKDQKYQNLLKKHNIGCSPIWPALHLQPAMKKFVESNDQLFPNSSLLTKQILWIPSSTKLLDDEIDQICKIIENYV